MLQTYVRTKVALIVALDYWQIESRKKKEKKNVSRRPFVEGNEQRNSFRIDSPRAASHVRSFDYEIAGDYNENPRNATTTRSAALAHGVCFTVTFGNDRSRNARVIPALKNSFDVQTRTVSSGKFKFLIDPVYTGERDPLVARCVAPRIRV